MKKYTIATTNRKAMMRFSRLIFVEVFIFIEVTNQNVF